MTLKQAVHAGGDHMASGAGEARALARRLTLQPLALYSAAAMRIGLAGLFFFNLLREWSHADHLWGPGAALAPGMFEEYLRARGLDDHPLSWWYGLLGTESPAFFWTVYVLAVLVALLYLLGWHTRVVAVLFAFLGVAFYVRGGYDNGGWEFVSLNLTVYLVFCASGRRWSLDARRRARRGPAETGRLPAPWSAPTEELRRRTVTVLHNAGMGIIAFQVMVIYGTAAMYKIRGETWQQGTALTYAMQLDAFSSWPEISGWLVEQSNYMAVLAYVTVFAQLLFPALVFNRRLKYVILALMLGIHAGIGIFMALPMFSAITIVCDLVFLPDTFWLRAAALLRMLRAPADRPTAAGAEKARTGPAAKKATEPAAGEDEAKALQP
ncbi:HTTM domain-containing protein [Streptomyces sp. A7024]|uniref:HTTM domain-containing protein n=1 Tax=Streptomyces coryli TaxID=1128680 RepID=A0A6G4U1V7_9ACTN|nr:HTTM domain-containing protein [Streptomyces coryli]NGN65982.1 HTTM domain-containing protein [Streptomyces coryli]